LLRLQKKLSKTSEDFDDDAENKLFNHQGLPWTKISGVGKMHGINTAVNVQEWVDKML